MGRFHDALRLERQGDSAQRLVFFARPIRSLERFGQAGVFIKVLAGSAKAALELAALPERKAGVAFLLVACQRDNPLGGHRVEQRVRQLREEDRVAFTHRLHHGDAGVAADVVLVRIRLRGAVERELPNRCDREGRVQLGEELPPKAAVCLGLGLQHLFRIGLRDVPESKYCVRDVHD